MPQPLQSESDSLTGTGSPMYGGGSTDFGVEKGPAAMPLTLQDQGAAAEDDGSFVEEEQGNACQRFWARWKYLILAVTYSFLCGAGGTFMGPVLPGIKRRYFGSDQKAAEVQTIIQGIAAALGMFAAPVLGVLMDVIGRRPFFVVNAAGQVAGFIILLLDISNPMAFMLVQGVFSILSNAFANAYLADHYSPKLRGSVYGFLFAGNQSTTLMTFLVFKLSDYTLVAIAVGTSAAALLISLFLVRESIPATDLKSFRCADVPNPFRSMKMLLTSKIVITTVVILGLFSISQSGVGEVYFYYLNERVGFDSKDNAICFIIVGCLSLLVFLVLLPVLTRVVGLRQVTLIMVSCVALAAEMLLMCFVDAKWQVFWIGLPASTLVNLSNPAITSIIANSATDDQGRRQAGLAALSSFFQTFAPLFFGQTYSHLSGNWVLLPFAAAGILSIPGFFLAWKLRQWVINQDEPIADENKDDTPCEIPDPDSPTKFHSANSRTTSHSANSRVGYSANSRVGYSANSRTGSANNRVSQSKCCAEPVSGEDPSHFV